MNNEIETAEDLETWESLLEAVEKTSIRDSSQEEFIAELALSIRSEIAAIECRLIERCR